MKPGEIYWVDLPPANGHEQAGRRPALILQDDAYAAASPLVLLIPLTTAPSVQRFPGVVSIPAAPENDLQTDSFGLVFQLRAIDRRRIRERLGSVAETVLAEIHAVLNRLFGRSNA